MAELLSYDEPDFEENIFIDNIDNNIDEINFNDTDDHNCKCNFEEYERRLKLDLREWKIKNPSVTHIATTGLLVILRKIFLGLPATSKTLMKPDPKFTGEVNIVDDFQILHLNFSELLTGCLEEYRDLGYQLPDPVCLMANSDGVTTTKSNSKGYTTFFLSPVNLKLEVVIPSCLVYGQGQPPNLDWLKKPIKEVVSITNSGICGVRIKFLSFCLDLKAYIYIKQIKAWSSLGDCCPVCNIQSVYSRDAGFCIINPNEFPRTAFWSHDDFRDHCLDIQDGKPSSPILYLDQQIDLIFGFPPGKLF